MKNRTLYVIWAGLFVLCAGLGFLPSPDGALRVFLTAMSLVFFLPPAWLVYGAVVTGDRRTLGRICRISLISLGATLLAMIVNIVAAVGSEAVGNVLHGVLVIVSAPMICSGYWALSLFAWACLLIAAWKYRRGK